MKDKFICLLSVIVAVTGFGFCIYNIVDGGLYSSYVRFIMRVVSIVGMTCIASGMSALYFIEYYYPITRRGFINFLGVVITAVYCLHLICSVVALTMGVTSSYLFFLPASNPTLAMFVVICFDKMGGFGNE